jgi:hypothetical protein
MRRSSGCSLPHPEYGEREQRMNGVRTAELFRRVDAIEHAWCLRLNRGCSQPAIRDVFSAISKLGSAPMAKVQDGFERHAAALKQRCETPGQ